MTDQREDQREDQELILEQIAKLTTHMRDQVSNPEYFRHVYLIGFFAQILENIEALPEARELRRKIGQSSSIVLDAMASLR